MGSLGKGGTKEHPPPPTRLKLKLFQVPSITLESPVSLGPGTYQGHKKRSMAFVKTILLRISHAKGL